MTDMYEIFNQFLRYLWPTLLVESFLQAKAILTMNCSDEPLSSHNQAHAILSSATFDSLI